MQSNTRLTVQARLRLVHPVFAVGYVALAVGALVVVAAALLATAHRPQTGGLIAMRQGHSLATRLPTDRGRARPAQFTLPATSDGRWSGGQEFNVVQTGAAVVSPAPDEPAPAYSVRLHPAGYGAIELSPTGPYTVGQVITAYADPSPGWQFDHWSGPLDGAQNPLTFTISTNVDLTATFVVQTEPGQYHVTLGKVGGGQVGMTPENPFVDGQAVLITALPDAGWQFDRWSGDIGSYQNPLTLVVNGDTEVIALFALATLVPTLTVALTKTGEGEVMVDPPGPYVAGQTVTLTASAASGWSFSGWGKDLAGAANPYAINILSNTAVLANFIPEVISQTYPLTVGVTGNGAVTALPPGPYEAGEVVTLRATPQPGWRFAGWSGDHSGLANPHSFTIQAATTLTATFEPLDVVLAVAGEGKVQRDPPGPLPAGQVILLTANPATGWRFAGWAGDLSGSDNPVLMTVTHTVTVTAIFTRDETGSALILTLTQMDGGQISVQPRAPYQRGQQVTLTAQAEPGRCFQSWQGDQTSRENPLQLTLLQDVSIGAQFGPCALFLPMVSAP